MSKYNISSHLSFFKAGDPLSYVSNSFALLLADADMFCTFWYMQKKPRQCKELSVVKSCEAL